MPESGAGRAWMRTGEARIALAALVAIACHLVIRFGVPDAPALGRFAARDLPLLLALAGGGVPLVWTLLRQAWRREFGSDLLAGISIVTAVLLGEYLAGTLVVLMLSGGQALESYAVRSASSVLEALARRMPSVAHRRQHNRVVDVALDEIAVDDVLEVFPHEICPVDGVVVEGHGVMDEAYLTGEPYRLSKTPGSEVLSGAINGEIRRRQAVPAAGGEERARDEEGGGASHPVHRSVEDGRQQAGRSCADGHGEGRRTRHRQEHRGRGAAV